MVVDVALAALYMWAGSSTARALGLRGWGVYPVGYLVGVFFYISVGFIQVVTPISEKPILTIAVTSAVGVVATAFVLARSEDIRARLRFVIEMFASASAAALIAAGLSTLELVKWSADSLAYMGGAGLIARDLYAETASSYLVVERLIGTSLVHAPASFTDDFQVPSFTPMLSLATLAVIAWLLRTGFPEAPTNRYVTSVVIAAAILLTSSRYLFTSFYVNGHMIVAAAILGTVGATWIMRRGTIPDTRALFVLVVFANTTLVVTRPEGAFLAILASAPLFLSSAIIAWRRVFVVGALGLTMVAWNIFVWLSVKRADQELEYSTYLQLGIGIVMLLGAMLVALPAVVRRETLLLGILEAALWGVVAFGLIVYPEKIVKSAGVTVYNQVLGGWGVTLVVVTLLLIFAALRLRFSDLTALRFAVTTFVPLSLIVMLARGGAYRIGLGDSLNRALVHLLPLAVLLLAAYILAGVERQGGWRESLSRISWWRTKVVTAPN